MTSFKVLQILEVLDITSSNFPEDEVLISTLDDFFGPLSAAAPHLKLPVITGEVGDSWIGGELCSISHKC